MGGGLRLLGACNPGAEAARVAVRNPGARYRADFTGPAGTVLVAVIDGNRGRDPARCSSSDCKKDCVMFCVVDVHSVFDVVSKLYIMCVNYRV